FASRLLDRLGLKIDLAFLDGMHLFEYLLRDFINTERHMAPDGLVTLHDCVPFNRVMAERDWDRAKTRSWTGDVWKLVPILRAYRPDLTVEVLDLAPTGLVTVRNLDPENTSLADQYDEIVSKYLNVTLADFGLEKLCETVRLQPAPTTAGKKPRTGSCQFDKIAIRTSITNAAVAETWGEHWFALGLKAAFERKGLPTHIDHADNWADDHGGGCLNLFLLGHDQFTAPDDQPTFVWYIYPGKRFKDEDLGRYDHVFVASELFARRLRRIAATDHVSYLPQAFDADLMRPADHAEPCADAVFVAKAHFRRSEGIAKSALDAGVALKIWGDLWQKPFDEHVVAKHLDNKRLPVIYGAAAAVLCDHHPMMRRRGFVSNRIFDALACGAPVICDEIDALPAEFAPFVEIAANGAEFAAAFDRIRKEGSEKTAARRQFARAMVDTHSFDARVDEILRVARSKHYSMPGSATKLAG
ncbi:MAG: glycosyltransferase, partial [Paracoccaceae bacterium]